MQNQEIFFAFLTTLVLYCTGASWMLQFVCYPNYKMVGAAEFVPFHVDFGNRLLRFVVIPMSVTNLLMIGTIFYRPQTIPLWGALVLTICATIIMFTTIMYEVPKHVKLDKEGKNDNVLKALVKDNIPRTICWTIAALTSMYFLTCNL